jgi:hypothetical protein
MGRRRYTVFGDGDFRAGRSRIPAAAAKVAARRLAQHGRNVGVRAQTQEQKEGVETKVQFCPQGEEDQVGHS